MLRSAKARIENRHAMPEHIQVATTEAIASITLDRPAKRNALSIALRDEVSDALEELAADTSIRVVVLTGAGDVFSAGFDLREFGIPDPEHQRRLWESSDRFHHAVLRFPLPTIAAVNGPALAGGFDLAVLCDIRIASDTASFAHPEHAFGEVVYGPLHDLVGGAIARDLMFTGRTISATEALALGIVSQVASRVDFHSTVARTAAKIAAAPREILVKNKAKAIARANLPPTTRTLDL
jgi:enoyl-CoA hydratase/carnithine racemase